jgi:hypothetical protein
MKNFYIKPACMPYYYNSKGEKEYKEDVEQNIAYTADGYLLPCCWCDAPSTRKDIEKAGLYQDKLLVSKNKNIEDILFSLEWKYFIKNMLHKPKDAPRCCKEKCGYYDE